MDYHSTTPVDPRVAEVMLHSMTVAFGNPNSTEHAFGEESALLISAARREIAQLLDASPQGVHFTSGSTESARLAIGHAVACRHDGPLRIALSTVEHQAVKDIVADYEDQGLATVHWLPVDRYARLDLATVEEACHAGVDLVCAMAANNEVGTLYPVREIARIAGRAGAQTFVDATQAAGHIPLSIEEWGIAYLSISAHKFYGPKGIGALVVHSGASVQQPSELASGTTGGTPNVPGITGLGEACRLRRLEMAEDHLRVTNQRDHLEAQLLAEIDGLVINGDHSSRLGGNLHISIPGVPNDAVIARLRGQVALSSGAACSSGAQASSHVLRAMRLPDELQDGALRIGIGKFTTDEEIGRAATHISHAVTTIRDAMGVA